MMFFLARYFSKDKKILAVSLIIFFGVAYFELFFAGSQFLFKRPLGKILEEGVMLAPYGKTAAEDIFRTRSFGTFSDPNTLAIFLLMMVPLFSSQAIHQHPLVKNKLLVSGALLASLGGLVFTFSRAAWAVLSVSLLIFLAHLRRNRRLSFKLNFARSKSYLAILVVIFLMIFPLVIERIASLRVSLWGDYEEYSSLRARIDLVKEAFFMISRHPLLGVGPGNFLGLMSETNITGVANRFYHPVHSLFLLLASELGLPALFCLGSFFWLALKEGWQKPVNKEIKGIKLGIFMGIVSYFGASLFYSADKVSLIFLFLLMGILGSL